MLLGTLFGLSLISWGQGGVANTEKRPVTVEDAIRTSRIAGTGYPGVHPKSGFAVFSPNGTRFAFVISKANVEKNTNDYSLLVFYSADVFNHGTPRTVASFSSSSNREGIVDISWSKDNKTIFFLGARGEETTQLYAVQCDSRKLKKLTNHPTSLVSYTVSDRGDMAAYLAEKPEIKVADSKVLRYGLHISTETAWDLIRGYTENVELELFAKENGAVVNKRLYTQGRFYHGGSLYLSPNGRYLVAETDTADIPDRWKEYQDSNLQFAFRLKLHKGYQTNILRYELVDTNTGKGEVLLDSPAFYVQHGVLWSTDSNSVLLCGVHLPLDVEDPGELQSRRQNTFVIQVSLPGRLITKITSDDLTPVHWDEATGVVQFRMRGSQDEQGGNAGLVSFRFTANMWERINAISSPATRPPLDVFADEDLHSPPRIVAVDVNTKRKTTLLDLNPQFASLKFGKVEEVSWKDDTGHPVSGGLYLPPDYIPGKKYPLVIQTHGFHPHEFAIDGSYPTAFAAQSLASKGIVVLQMDDIFSDALGTPEEAERAMDAYENAIQYLDQKAIIDRSRVGLIGFSRTCLYVKYALTHSSQHYAAAVAADGFDGGYLQYLFNANANANSDSDSVIGAQPFGAGLAVWLKRSPGFMLERVETPILAEATSPGSLLGEWQWFSGLRLLDKPVDLVYLPTATHVLVKPWDRIVSLSATVDWFSFWLKGEEDPDPAKAEQYVRWRELKKMQGEDGHKLKSAPTN
jgi:dipeptidyl aminopeptidase/acylaminoacyl peptidase